ncbi:MAG: hypothetical protein AAF485_09460 [Chloroflexota bacterium]
METNIPNTDAEHDDVEQAIEDTHPNTVAAYIANTKLTDGGFFPHEVPSEHWDVDFGDSHEVYEGTSLPLWILAGWAAFILWAVTYLALGLPTAF